MSDTPPLVCNVCGEIKGLKRCGFCKVKFYCSREHQIKDWPTHKTFCQNKRKENETVGLNGNSSNQTNSTVDKAKSDSANLDEQKDGTPTNEIESSEQKNDIESKTSKRNGIPFDTRPYLPVKTVAMTSSDDYSSIAKIAVENLKLNGYCVMEGVFPDRLIDKALRDFYKLEKRGRFQTGKLKGGRTSGEEDKKVVNAGIRSDKIVWVEGDENETPGVGEVLNKMDHVLVQFNDLLDGKYEIANRTKAMMACYPGDGSYYKRHIDNPNKDGRVVTCILYLNKDWVPETHGGTLRILPSEGDSYVDVPPAANHLLFFWSDRRNPHEVHPAYRTRYAITVWYMDKKERDQAQLDHLQAEMAKIRGTEQMAGLKQWLEKRDKLNKQIEDTTNQAISSLTEEELAAIGEMVEGESNPREVLASLGIYPVIQDKLLERLKQTKIIT